MAEELAETLSAPNVEIGYRIETKLHFGDRQSKPPVLDDLIFLSESAQSGDFARV